jgi:hypothetical protein
VYIAGLKLGLDDYGLGVIGLEVIVRRGAAGVIVGSRQVLCA